MLRRANTVSHRRGMKLYVAFVKGLHMTHKSYLKRALITGVHCCWSLMKPFRFLLPLFLDAKSPTSQQPESLRVAVRSLFHFKDGRV